MAAYREPMSVNERAPISSQQVPHNSPWHSPVPYLFGGLAAMLGLIAFALLILACSYWKLSGYLDDNNNTESSQRDLESGGGDAKNNNTDQKPYEEKFLVIMAGQDKPTFLATPSMSSSTSTSRSSSFGDNSSTCTCDRSEKSSENLNGVTVKERISGGGGGVGENQVRRTESVELPETSSDQNV